VGTLAHDIPDIPRPLTWLWDFLKHELAPYPGRVLTVARMVLAATLVMIICNTFRIPYAFLGGIYALLISRESPRATLSSAGTVLLLAAAGVAYMLVSCPSHNVIGSDSSGNHGTESDAICER
jgi:multidrug resistance protein MdtO